MGGYSADGTLTSHSTKPLVLVPREVSTPQETALTCDCSSHGHAGSTQAQRKAGCQRPTRASLPLFDSAAGMVCSPGGLAGIPTLNAIPTLTLSPTLHPTP